MISVIAVKPIKVKLQDGLRTFRPGDAFEVNHKKADPLIKQGILRLVKNIATARVGDVTEYGRVLAVIPAAAMAPIEIPAGPKDTAPPAGPGADFFRRAFKALIEKVQAAGPVLEWTQHHDAIQKALNRADQAWEAFDRPRFHDALQETNRLIDAALAEDIKTKNFAIRIRSHAIGADAWIVSNKQVRDHLEAEGLTVFLAEEAPGLRGLNPAALKKAVEVKKVFECRFIETRKGGGSDVTGARNYHGMETEPVAIREEFLGQIELYAAFRKAEAAGRINILKK